jgi:hypothetical protein
VTYRRDGVVGAALGVPVRHVPVAAARALAGAATLAGRPDRLSRYAVDQLTDGLVLDLGKARAAQGFAPRRTFGQLV